MNNKLKDLNLTNDEWNTLFEYITKYCNAKIYNLEISRFEFWEEVESLFYNHELAFNFSDIL